MDILVFLGQLIQCRFHIIISALGQNGQVSDLIQLFVALGFAIVQLFAKAGSSLFGILHIILKCQFIGITSLEPVHIVIQAFAAFAQLFIAKAQFVLDGDKFFLTHAGGGNDYQCHRENA